MNLFEEHKKSGWEAFETYKVEILLKDLVGGRPKTKKMIKSWVNATCKKKSAEERQKIIDAHVSMLGEITEEKADDQAIVFARMPDGQLAIEGRQVKAMLKEAGNICKEIVPAGRVKEGAPKEGVTALRSKVADKMFVVEDYIPLNRTEPDETLEKPIHVMTPQGPRDSIKKIEILRDVPVTFTIKRRRGPDRTGVPEKAMLAILDYAQTSGLGADRSQGRGQFEVINVERID
jgi:hypothetical protein